MSSTPPPHALQEITIDRADGDVDRVGPDPPEVSVQTPLNTCTPRGVRSKTNFGLYILHVCFATIYIFMTSQDTQPGWFKTVRLVITGLYFINSVILSFLNPDYLLQHILPITGIFSVIAMVLYYLIGGGVLTDGIGVVMVSVLISTICPELKGDLTALFEDRGTILPV